MEKGDPARSICFSWPLGMRQGSSGRKVGEGIWLPRTESSCRNRGYISLGAKISAKAPDPISNGNIPFSSYLSKIFYIYLFAYFFILFIVFTYMCVGTLPQCMCLRTCGNWFSSQRVGPGY